MDAKALLAVYSKVSKLYTDKEGRRFLSFPHHNHYSFDPEMLTQLGKETGLLTATALQRMNDFSHHVNLPARTVVYDPTNERYLWDAYSDVVNGAVVADGPGNAQEAEQEYENALKLLYKDGDALKQEFTDVYAKYREIDDELYNVISELTYSVCDDARKAELARRKGDLETRIIIEGNSVEVRKALGVIESVTRNNPACIWEKLKNSFNADTNTVRTAEGSSFYPTYIFPSDVHLQQWDKVTIGAEEIEKLYEEAPELLKGMLPVSDTEENIREICFECRSVKLDRPWMDSDVFESRMWKFAQTDNYLPLSCGLDSVYGSFPAYVTSLILARNVRVSTAHEKLVRFPVKKMRLTPKPAKKTVVTVHEYDFEEITVLAYNCKKLDVCPCPDPEAAWGISMGQGALDLKQSPGGHVEARVNGALVDGGYFNEWQEIHLNADPDEGYVLDSWMINSERHSSSSINLSVRMCVGQMEIRPVWKRGEELADMDYELSDDGKTLLAWKGKTVELDMNSSSELLGVETIGEDAFAGNLYIRRVRVGEKVKMISKGSFRDCVKLEKIHIPASVISIDPEIFSPKPSFDVPVVEIDPANEVYEILDGHIFDKGNVMEVNVVECPACKMRYFYPYDRPEGACPACGKELPDVASSVRLIRPEKFMPFMTVESDMISSLREYCSKKSFLSDAFKAAVSTLNLNIRKAYLPFSMTDVKIHSEYSARIVRKETPAEGGEPKEKIVKVDGSYDTHIKKSICQLSAYDKDSSFVGSTDDMEKFGNGSVLTDIFAEMPVNTVSDAMVKSHGAIEDSLKQTIINKKVRENCELDLKAMYSDIKFSMNLFPCWIGYYEFEGTVYKILVDGQNGRVIRCDYPKDSKKMMKVGLIVAGVIAIIILLIILL